MESMNDIFLKEDMNLDEYLILTREEGNILAVKTKYIGIKQRQDRMMSINFNVSPPQMKEIESFFDGINDFDTLYYNISQTGFVPVNFRGLSSVTRNVGADDDTMFSLSILLEPTNLVPKDSYIEPTCDCCVFHHIK